MKSFNTYRISIIETEYIPISFLYSQNNNPIYNSIISKKKFKNIYDNLRFYTKVDKDRQMQ